MSMPAFVFEQVTNDAIWIIIFDFCIELALTFLITYAIVKNPNKQFFEVLCEKFGKIIAHIIVLILFVFMIFKLHYALQEIYSFFKEFLYDDFEPLIFAIPTFFLLGYLAKQGARTIGRTLEILFIFITIGLIVSMISNLSYVEVGKMMPYMTQGFAPILFGSLKSMFYFGNAIPLLFFMGKVKINQDLCKKTILSASILAIFITIFAFIFYSVYGYSAGYAIFALSDYTQYDPYIIDLQRLNWLSNIIDVTKLFCSASILLYCLGISGQNLIKSKSTLIPIFISIVIVYLNATLTNYDIDILKTYISNWVSYFTLSVIILCIIISIICSKNKERKT